MRILEVFAFCDKGEPPNPILVSVWGCHFLNWDDYGAVLRKNIYEYFIVMKI